MTNNAQNAVELKYNVNGQEQKQEFPVGAGGSFDVTVQGSVQPAPIEFKAYKTGTTTIVQLNGQDNLMVTPTETKIPVNVAVGGGAAAGGGGMSMFPTLALFFNVFAFLSLFFFCNSRSLV